MKYLLSILLVVLFAVPGNARTFVPDYGISVTSNANWEVLTTEVLLDDAIETLDNAIDQVTGDNLTLSGRVTTLESATNSLSGRVGTNETNITVLQGQSATNTANITTNSANIATNTADIATLQTNALSSGSMATCLTIGGGPGSFTVTSGSYEYLPVGTYKQTGSRFTYGDFSAASYGSDYVEIPTDGAYLISASLGFSDAAAINGYVHIFRSAALWENTMAIYYGNTQEGSVAISYRLEAGDKVYIGLLSDTTKSISVPWIGLSIMRLNPNE